MSLHRRERALLGLWLLTACSLSSRTTTPSGSGGTALQQVTPVAPIARVPLEPRPLAGPSADAGAAAVVVSRSIVAQAVLVAPISSAGSFSGTRDGGAPNDGGGESPDAGEELPCDSPCPVTQQCCAGRCSDPAVDSTNCGMCGTFCPGGKRCIDGSCGAACDANNCDAGTCCGNGVLCCRVTDVCCALPEGRFRCVDPLRERCPLGTDAGS
jgi:Stigma-specific protein, Stig1